MEKWVFFLEFLVFKLEGAPSSYGPLTFVAWLHFFHPYPFITKHLGLGKMDIISSAWLSVSVLKSTQDLDFRSLAFEDPLSKLVKNVIIYMKKSSM